MKPGPQWHVCTQGVGSGSLILVNPLKKHHYYTYLIGLDHGNKASDCLITDSYLNFTQ